MKAAVKAETRSIFPHDQISLVDPDAVIEYLNGNPSPETVDQLYDFGKLLLDQIRALRDSYDSKLTHCLGWSAGLFAVVMVAAKDWVGVTGVVGITASAGVVFAFGSVIMSIVGLKSVAGWKWPSERDWFDKQFLSWPGRLKQQHLVLMIEAHRSYSERTQRKGYSLMIAEYLLAGAAICLGVAVMAKALIF
jgi:pimeloyl-ACP methyl ester carboxylesterase